MTHDTPMDRLFAGAQFTCGKCGAKCKGVAHLACDCWSKCECGWFIEKGHSCNNPDHGPKTGTKKAVVQRVVATGTLEDLDKVLREQK